MTLTNRRCFNHHNREAVARCPECGSYFCRECTTEHDGRMICTKCLESLTYEPFKGAGSAGLVAKALLALAGVLVAWLAFYGYGRVLVNTEHDRFESWQQPTWEDSRR